MSTLNPIKPLSLRANFSWTFAGNIVYAASQWGMLVVLARLGTPEMVGQFALGLAITAPVIMFANLQLRAVQATDARRDYTFGEYLGLRLVSTGLACGVIGVIVWAAGYRGETALVILLVGLAKAFEAVSDVIYGLLQQRERMDRIAQAMMIKGPVSLAALAAGVLLTGSVVGGVVGMIVVWGLLLVVYDLHSARLLVESGRALYPRWKLRRLMALAWLALPLGFSMLVVSLNTNIPRYVLERYQGEAQLGFFAAMAYLIIAGNTVIWSLGQSASPRLAAYYVKGDKRAYVRLLLRLLVISGALGLAGIILAVLVGEWVLSLFYGSEYAVHNDVFVWIMIAGAINYVVFATRYAVIAARVFKVQIVLSGISVLTTGAASLLLIPRGGLQVVATALLVINSLNLFMEIAVMIWVLKKPLSDQTGADK